MVDSAEIWIGCLSFVVGLGTGILFYMGLWWTICFKTFVTYPLLLGWASFILRVMATASIFYWMANAHFGRYLSLWCGFMLSRKVILNSKTS